MAAGKIVIVGLGPGGLNLIPVQNLQVLKNGSPLYVRTAQHPAVDELQALGVKFASFDYLYTQGNTFEEVYQAIVDKLLDLTGIHAEIVYAVPGHPMVAESTVPLLKERASKAGLDVAVLPAMSCLEAIYAALELDPTAGIAVQDALLLTREKIKPSLGLIVTQLYSRRIASEVKLTLMEIYDDHHEVCLIAHAGNGMLEKKELVPLYGLDRISWIDHMTSLYVPPQQEQRTSCSYALDPLVNVMQTLLGENGCPWDREQTHETLKRYLIEECYEVIEAIEERNMYKFCDELGDLLLQIVFHAELASRRHHFSLNDVVEMITEKMIRRHPHVFGETQVANATEVLANWDEIKRHEKETAGQKSIMDIPRGLPALYRAEKIQNRAAKVGFDWPDLAGPWDKLLEELAELQEAIRAGNPVHIKEEAGDVLFAVVNICRFIEVDPEEALHNAAGKFVGRFRVIEGEALRMGKDLQAMSLDEMNMIWEKSKKC